MNYPKTNKIVNTSPVYISNDLVYGGEFKPENATPSIKTNPVPNNTQNDNIIDFSVSPNSADKKIVLDTLKNF